MKSKKILSIVSLFLFFIVLFFSVVTVYKIWYMEGIIDKNITTYTENKISKYDGGEEAEKFFPQYSSLQNFEKISFVYCDNRKKSNYFHEYYSYFCLDVMFEEYFYTTYVETIKETDAILFINDFSVLKQEYSNSVCKAVLCNDNEKIIRYIMFYGDFEEDVSLQSLIMWNMI